MADEEGKGACRKEERVGRVEWVSESGRIATYRGKRPPSAAPGFREQGKGWFRGNRRTVCGIVWGRREGCSVGAYKCNEPLFCGERETVMPHWPPPTCLCYLDFPGFQLPHSPKTLIHFPHTPLFYKNKIKTPSIILPLQSPLYILLFHPSPLFTYLFLHYFLFLLSIYPKKGQVKRGLLKK